MTVSRCLVVALAVSLALSGCTCAPRARELRRWHLTTLPESYRDRTIVVADDGALAAYSEIVSDGDRVVTGTTPGPVFAEIAPPRMAPRSQRVFYWALDTQRGAPRIVLSADGTRIDAPIARPGKLVFPPDGTRWAAVGGTEDPTAMIPGPDDYQPGPVLLWVDGQQSGRYPDMALPAFSPDGRHLALLVDAGGGATELFVDGVRQRRFEAPPAAAAPVTRNEPVGPNMVQQFVVRYLSDGTLLVLTTDPDGWSLWRGERRLASYLGNAGSPGGSGMTVQFGGPLASAASIVAGSLTSAADAPVAAWWARAEGAEERWHVVRDGTPEPVACTRAWDSEPPALSADGRHVAYACHASAADRPPQVFVQHDATRYGPFANAWGVTLSADGRHVAFAADNGAAERPWYYQRDGRAFGLTFDRAYPPRFSADGRHLAWVGERNGKVILFFDGDSVASSDNIIWAPTFALKPDTLSWAVLRDRRVSRVDMRY